MRLQLPLVLKLIHLGTCTAKVCCILRLWFINLMIVLLSWEKKCLNSAGFPVTGALLPSGAEWGSYIWGGCSACSVHVSDPVFFSGNFLETDRVQPSCVLNHTFNAGTNWLCYFSWMWALLTQELGFRGLCNQNLSCCLGSWNWKNIRMYKEICFLLQGQTASTQKQPRRL